MTQKVTSWIINAPDRDTLCIPGPGDVIMKLKHGTKTYDPRLAQFYGHELFIPVIEDVQEPNDVLLLLNEEHAMPMTANTKQDTPAKKPKFGGRAKGTPNKPKIK